MDEVGTRLLLDLGRGDRFSAERGNGSTLKSGTVQITFLRKNTHYAPTSLKNSSLSRSSTLDDLQPTPLWPCSASTRGAYVAAFIGTEDVGLSDLERCAAADVLCVSK